MSILSSQFQQISVPNVTIPQFVFEKDFGDKVAVVDGYSGFSLTFTQLKGLIDRVSKNLYHDFAFRKGQCFAIMLPNHPMYPAFLFGVLGIGGVATTVNPVYTREELNHQLKDSGARLIVTIPMFLDNLIAALPGTRIEAVLVLSQDGNVEQRKQVKLITANALLKPCANNSPLNVEIDPKKDLAFLPYSSGTTGLSKGVMLTHANVIANVVQIEGMVNFKSTEVVLGLLPFFHIYGLVVVINKAMRSGCTIVTIPKFELVPFLETIQKYKVSYAPLVPPVILALAKHPIVAKYDISSLREIMSGAAPLAPSLALEVNQKKGILVKNGYGMTEASPVLATTLDDDIDCSSVGVLPPSTELKVVDVATGKVLGEGEEGELCFRGPQVMQGYLNNPEATANTIKQGWLHSGDIGYHKAGKIYITDRLKELIKVKGFQVPPAELESLLLKHPGIADAAVIGVPDERAGELPKAFVVKRPNVELSEKQVMEHVDSHVAHHKRIRYVEFVPEIPKTASGKVLRRVLKDRQLASKL